MNILGMATNILISHRIFKSLFIVYMSAKGGTYLGMTVDLLVLSQFL